MKTAVGSFDDDDVPRLSASIGSRGAGGGSARTVRGGGAGGAVGAVVVDVTGGGWSTSTTHACARFNEPPRFCARCGQPLIEKES